MSLTSFSKPSRRDVLRQLALAVTAAGANSFNIEAAKVVHELAVEAREQSGNYVPKAFTDHQFQTVTRLAELIIPADDGGPSAVDADAPEFIDLLCSQNDQLLSIFVEGVSWLDTRTQNTHQQPFVQANETAQRTLIDVLVQAERGRMHDELRQGVTFFDWARRMTVDAYYTSPIGIADIDFQGNKILRSYDTPAEVVEFIHLQADKLGL